MAIVGKRIRIKVEMIEVVAEINITRESQN